MKVWMSHGDKLSKLPKGFQVIASTQNSEYAGIAHESKPIYGTFLAFAKVKREVLTRG